MSGKRDSIEQGTAPDSAGQQCPEPLIDSAELAKHLGVTVRTVRTMTNQKRLPVLMVGGTCARYRLSDVLAYIASKSPRARK